MKLQAFLKEWFILYAKHKDLFTRSIKEVKDISEGQITVEHKDKSLKVFLVPLLAEADKVLAGVKKDEHVTIVTVNDKRNLDYLLHAWKTIVPYARLNIFFVNSFSNLDKRWVIFPSTHDRISDSASLKLGLESMFIMVEPITVEEYEKKV